MTDPSKAIRAEIERMKEIHERNLKKPMERGRIGFAHGVVECCDRILSFIDDLPEIEGISQKVPLIPQWKWIDPKYEYPVCLTREMDENGDWNYCISTGRIRETCQYISLAELELLSDEPIDVEAARKNLDEKIKLTTESGSWKGVDVDEFMDEMRTNEEEICKESLHILGTYKENGDSFTDELDK